METHRHLMQQLALIATLQWLWRDRRDYFVGGNLTVYFSPTQKKSEDFRGPDFFVALDCDGTRDRRSWVVWEEGGKYPNVIIELLSDSTEGVDRGDKKTIYEQVFRTPEYFLFDPYTCELEGYRLVGGHYQPIARDSHGLLACEQLELCLGVHAKELRWYSKDGVLVAKPEETAASETRRAASEAHRADVAERRAEKAEAELAKLRAELAARGKT